MSVLRRGLGALAYRGRRLRARVRTELRRRSAREGWSGEDVAREMEALALAELGSAEDVPPFRVARESLAWALERGLPEPARLLDAGCGVGAYGEAVERWFPGRFEYVGADLSPDLVAAAERLWPGRRFVVADVLAGELADGFDVVLAAGLVDVVERPLEALDALLASRAPYVLLHRQRIVADRARVETADGYAARTIFRTSLTLADVEAAAARHGREIGLDLPVVGNTRSFVLVRGA